MVREAEQHVSYYGERSRLQNKPTKKKMEQACLRKSL